MGQLRVAINDLEYRAMKKICVCCAAFALLIGLSGCGSSPDSLMKKKISLLSEFTDALESNAPPSKLADIKKRTDENDQKLAKLSEEDEKKLYEKHNDEMQKAMSRMKAALMNKGIEVEFDSPGLPNK